MCAFVAVAVGVCVCVFGGLHSLRVGVFWSILFSPALALVCVREDVGSEHPCAPGF